MRKFHPLKAFFAGLIGFSLIFSLAHGAVPKKIKSEMELVRENLHIGEATAKRIAAKLEEFKKSGQFSLEIINNYEIYLARVQSMVNENRKVLRGMELTYGRQTSNEELTNPDASEGLEEMLNPKIPEEQAIDEVAVLDQKFNNSLAEFDEMLLMEFNAIRDRSAKKMRDLAEEAAEAVKRLREKGVDLNTDKSESSSNAEEALEEEEKKAVTEKETADTENQSDPEEGEGDRKLATRDNSKEGDQDPSQGVKDRYDKEDDDIVARQLREAAENETDPELKAKLWKEYKEYRKNGR